MMFSALDAVRVARGLVDEGRTDSDAITTADMFACAGIAGAPAPDDAGMGAVRLAVDVLSRAA
jgi:hypothetical protein